MTVQWLTPPSDRTQRNPASVDAQTCTAASEGRIEKLNTWPPGLETQHVASGAGNSARGLRGWKLNTWPPGLETQHVASGAGNSTRGLRGWKLTSCCK